MTTVEHYAKRLTFKDKLAMSFSSLSVAEQHNLIATANAAVVRFARLFADKLGNRHFFSREDIEDIAGNTIMKVWRAMDSYDPEKGTLSTWVGRIAANCVKDAVDYKMKRLPVSGSMYAKRKKDDEECGADEYIMDSEVLNTLSENSADGRVLHSGLKERIDEEVASMSDKRRRIAYMMSMGYSAKEIAEAEGCSCNAVYKCVWDIRDALKKALSEWCDDSGRVAC